MQPDEKVMEILKAQCKSGWAWDPFDGWWPTATIPLEVRHDDKLYVVGEQTASVLRKYVDEIRPPRPQMERIELP